MNPIRSIFIALAVALSMALPARAAQPGPAQAPAIATFAGGCFWCVEEAFDKIDGVLSTTSGFMGGKVANPTYEQVTSGTTGHREVVRIVFDPARTSYEKLLDSFWRNVDPTQKNGQFCDSGEQYRSEIFVHDDAQKRAAEASRARLNQDSRFAGDIQTIITPASTFYPADDYHQDFHEKHFARYQYYKSACGRVARLRFLWRDR
ncbi:MAG TPA: peptide-methionine (S)-S-oxide reductase MsrA [Rhodocyclaceae bacterium]